MKRLGAWTDKYGFIAHPILFAIFPLLSFYGSNAAEISSDNFRLRTFLIFNLIVAMCLWLVSLAATLNVKKASIISVACLAVFFTFGRVHSQMINVSIKTPAGLLGPTKILLLTSLVLLGLVWLCVRRLSDESTTKVNSTLFLAGSVIISSALISIIVPSLSDGGSASDQSQQPMVATIDQVAGQGRPDIYYIVLDGYARADFLKDKFDYDNSDFLNALRDRGFYVADKANSNYAHTQLSIPSTFNMKYLNYLTDQMGAASTDREPLKDLLQNKNEVVHIFKSFGYKFVSIGSQWGWTQSSPLADLEVKTKAETDSKILNIKLDEFAQVYLQTTALKPWVSNTIGGNLVTRTLGAFEKTEDVSKLADQTLSLTHIVSPHPPYLFNANGVIPGQTQLQLDNQGFSDKNKFRDQTIFVNERVLEMVDNILMNSDKPPIIILASDHGPASDLKLTDIKQTDPSKFNIEGIKERMANLNTYYFPDKNYSKLYPSITPVNSFRLVLSQYFGQKLELLPDYSYFSNNQANEYLFHDVTDLVTD